MSCIIDQNKLNTPVAQTTDKAQSADKPGASGTLGGRTISPVAGQGISAVGPEGKRPVDAGPANGKAIPLANRTVKAASVGTADAAGSDLAQKFDRFVANACDFKALMADVRAHLFTEDQVSVVQNRCADVALEIRAAVADVRAKNGLEPKGEGDWAKVAPDQLVLLRDRIVELVSSVTQDVTRTTRRLSRPIEMPSVVQPAPPKTKPTPAKPQSAPTQEVPAPGTFAKAQILPQGTNTCYMMSVVNALLRTDEGTALMNDVCPNPSHPDSYLFKISEDVLHEAEQDLREAKDTVKGTTDYDQNDLKAAQRRVDMARKLCTEGLRISLKEIADKKAQLAGGSPPLRYSDLEVAIHLGEEAIVSLGNWYADGGAGARPRVPAFGRMGSCLSVAMLLGLRKRGDDDPLQVLEDGGFAILRKGRIGQLREFAYDAGHYQAIVGKPKSNPQTVNRFLVVDSISAKYEDAEAVRGEAGHDQVEDQVFCYALDPNWRAQRAALKEAQA